MSLYYFTITVFISFFAIMNPIANTPIFLGLVQGMNNQDLKKIARLGCITAFVIVAMFVVLGKYIFDLFSITIPAFKITGGLLIFYVGFEMLMSKKSSVHSTTVDNSHVDSSHVDSSHINNSHINSTSADKNKTLSTYSDNSGIAISPLAIPILAGPGTIVTAMNHATHGSMMHIGIVIAVFAVMMFLNYIAFASSDKIVKLVGQNMIAVVGKLMGLILAIIGTGMVIAGIKLSFNL